MKILVCGGRDYRDHEKVSNVLNQYKSTITALIEGGASGADALANEWAYKNEIPIQTFLAEWEKYGLAAGPLRNTKMLNDGKPDLVIAFPGGRGTLNMIKQAKNAGVEVINITNT